MENRQIGNWRFGPELAECHVGAQVVLPFSNDRSFRGIFKGLVEDGETIQLQAIPEVDFGGDIPDEPIARGVSSIELSVCITMGKAMFQMTNLVSQFGTEFARFTAELHRWATERCFRSRVEKRHSRTRRKQRPTRLQRRQKRQTKI